ncbi:transcription initiation factor TFIID component TAF4 family-domain-containing protein [Mycena alexandri]|uniref:Transcription initiation factor TFIID subunit 4 n=1 Tax=Mycena alexandri TaxID=1745969 RepID=A0AAD6WMK5_9AGAR|nr:transcription initiation factor TFIID component TAF4 family-domain-containing protein [Mycena alexandri]
MGTPAAPDWDSLIPIDPVLQQSQSQPAPTPPPATPYSPYTAYNQHYQQQPAYHAYQQQAAQQAQQHQHYIAPTPARQDSTSVATLNDAVGSAGVDVRAEEEKLRSTTTQSTASSSRVKLDRSRTQPLNPNFDLEVLKPRLAEIAAHHKLAGGIPEETANYVALALRTRLERLVLEMSVAARHRTDTQFDRPAALYAESLPMWSLVVRSDVAKQATMLERIEREEETKVRRERKERTDMATAHAAALAAQSGGGGGGGMDYDEEEGGKRKKKKDGPGVTARNMSEDVRKKMSNAVASQAAGLTSKYSWLTPGNAAAAAAAKPAATKTSTSTTTPSTAALPSTGGGWARAYVPPKKTDTPAPAPEPVEEDTRIEITIRDAQFVVEKERGHGGGRGSGKGWT